MAKNLSNRYLSLDELRKGGNASSFSKYLACRSTPVAELEGIASSRHEAVTLDYPLRRKSSLIFRDEDGISSTLRL